jgi:hypothetical protein
VRKFIKKCIGDVVPTVTIKPQEWMDGGIRSKLKVQTIAFKEVIWLNINSVVIPSVRQSDKLNAGTGTKWSHNSTAQTRDICGLKEGLQTITDYNEKTSHVTDVTLPDKLNTFFDRFEDNTLPPLWPTNKDCTTPPSPWPT